MIYPWDYPELTVLYSSGNSYWHEPALWGIWLIFLVAAAVTAAFLRYPKVGRDLELLVQPIKVDMSRRDPVRYGFNSPETWRLWSCLPEPFIQLRVGIKGALRETLHVWAGAEHAGQPMQFTIGEKPTLSL